MRRAFAIAFSLLCLAATALSKEATPDQSNSQDKIVSQPLGGGKPVTTKKIRRCPEGYELV
jgi:hypothetical protein